MDFTRIRTVIDVEKTGRAHVAIIGAGGSANLAMDLARCGVQQFTLVDFDLVDATNIARQGHQRRDIGRPKVDALAQLLRSVNPDADVNTIVADFTRFKDAEIHRHFENVDLFLFCTDAFAAQARGNQVALQLGKPAVWSGLYAGGRAGEVIFWHPGIPACYRCLTAHRYKAQERANREGRDLNPPSTGATTFDVHLLDSITGMIAVGLLTRSSPNRFGRIIDQLGDRNFLQIKIDPTYTWNDRDVIREQLRIPDDCDAYFSFCTIARADPDGGQPPCNDCRRFRHAVEHLSTAFQTLEV